MDEEQLRQLQVELKNAKIEYTKAKKVLDNIKALEVRYQKASELIDGVSGNINEAQTEVEENNQKVKTLHEEIKSIRTEISDYLDSADANITELQTLNERASELKGTIEGRSGEIDALLKSARTYTTDIEKLKKDAQGNLDKSDSLLSDFQKKVSEMQSAHTEFLQIQTRIEDKNTGLKAALEFVQQTQEQSEKILAEVNLLKKTATEQVEQIEKLKERSGDEASKVSENLEFVKERKSQIEAVTNLVIDGSFAETFERRKREIDSSINSDWGSWKYIMLTSVLLLVAAVFLPFLTKFSVLFNFGTLNGWDGFFIRFFYTSPLIFLVLFSAAQYSKERQFLEKYAFKAASSAAIRNHIEFLMERFTDKDVMRFAVGTFNSIYNEPFKTDNEKEYEKINLINFKKNKTNVQTQKNNLIDLVDKLYELVPDELIIKQTVDAVAEARKGKS